MLHVRPRPLGVFVKSSPYRLRPRLPGLGALLSAPAVSVAPEVHGTVLSHATREFAEFAARILVMAKLFIVMGIVLVIIGIAIGYAPWLFTWFGKLPGDIRIERESGVFFFPFTSMLLISVVVSLLLSLFFRR